MRFLFVSHKLLAAALLLVQLYAAEHAIEHIFASADDNVCELCLALNGTNNPIAATANSDLLAAGTYRYTVTPSAFYDAQPGGAYLARAPPVFFG